ncbi:hypothetical protein F01_230097 [Burkholderia cenocepacia]|nr:hypothetical protein F01_230097 [Burkholderia cenocepacia]
MRRHDPRALRRPVPRRPRTDGALHAIPAESLRTDRFPRERREGVARAGRIRRAGHLSRFMLGPARARREGAAARAARAARRRGDRDEGLRALLRLRRHVRGQVRRHLGGHRGREMRERARVGRGHRRARRSRLHAEHRRAVAPHRRPRHARAARRAGAGGRRLTPGSAHFSPIPRCKSNRCISRRAPARSWPTSACSRT